MKTIAMIPARFAATRFPGKLMETLGNKSVIRHTYDNTIGTKLFDEVIVVTDSQIIFDEITQNGGYVLMSKKQHESGTDRIAEIAANIEVDIILNVQGDEPFVTREPLQKLLKVFEDDHLHKVQVASIMKVIEDPRIAEDTNYVKVVVDNFMNSLYFSRAPIPYNRDKNVHVSCYEHVGVYAFRKQALMNFTSWNTTPLEAIEKIECLRYLENGVSLKMVLSEYKAGKIDTPDDLARAKHQLSHGV